MAMKIKIALLGLLFGNSIIHSVRADEYDDEVDHLAIIKEKNDKHKAKDEDQSDHCLKLGASVTINPTITWQDDQWSTENSPGAGLTFKAEVPTACCSKTTTLHIAAGWGGGKELGIKHAAVTIGKMVTIGQTATILGYEKADPSLLISPSASVLQIKYEHTFDWFRLGCAIEKPVALEVGLFDKTKKRYDKKEDKDEPLFNQLDDSKDKERAFKIRNSLPAIGLNLGIVTDHVNIALSGLGRCTDYTHSTDPDATKLPIKYCATYGGHLGIQYQVVPKKFTVTGQGAYVLGLGDYLTGLSAIQKDDERKEMSAAYYIDRNKSDLSSIDAFGVGGTLEYAVTPEWTFSIRGSYLKTLEDSEKSEKPVIAFLSQWNVVPNITYQANKYLTFSGGYSLVQEYRVDDKENKKPQHKLAGSIKFSLK
ncbi:hypothetical protein [Candidatus Cardinium sp. cByotN1]|nr:hypothetical protein [Candidatus Cardinium sp. cByotN1]